MHIFILLCTYGAVLVVHLCNYGVVRQLLDGVVDMCENVQNEGKKKKRMLMLRLRGATTSLAHSLDAK